MELRVDCDGVLYPVVRWGIRESVWSFSSEVWMELTTLLRGDVWEWRGTGCRYVVVSVEVLGVNSYRYLSYPEGYWKMCGMFRQPVCGAYTLSDVCSVLGLPFRSIHSLSSLVRHWWCFGSLRGSYLFETLTLGGACSGGGCSTLHYTVGGELLYCDLVASWDMPSCFGFRGRNDSYSVCRTSEPDVPGRLRMYLDGDGGVSEGVDLTFGSSGSLVGVYKSYLSNDELGLDRQWRSRNGYWRSYLRSRSFTFRGVELVGGTLCCGGSCTYLDGSSAGQHFVCVGYRSSFCGDVQDIELDVVRVD